jgi:hypothetical protein
MQSGKVDVTAVEAVVAARPDRNLFQKMHIVTGAGDQRAEGGQIAVCRQLEGEFYRGLRALPTRVNQTAAMPTKTCKI